MAVCIDIILRGTELKRGLHWLAPGTNELQQLVLHLLFMSVAQEVNSVREWYQLCLLGVFEQLDLFLGICNAEHNIGRSLNGD